MFTPDMLERISQDAAAFVFAPKTKQLFFATKATTLALYDREPEIAAAVFGSEIPRDLLVEAYKETVCLLGGNKPMKSDVIMWALKQEAVVGYVGSVGLRVVAAVWDNQKPWLRLAVPTCLAKLSRQPMLENVGAVRIVMSTISCCDFNPIDLLSVSRNLCDC